MERLSRRGHGLRVLVGGEQSGRLLSILKRKREGLPAYRVTQSTVQCVALGFAVVRPVSARDSRRETGREQGGGAGRTCDMPSESNS